MRLQRMSIARLTVVALLGVWVAACGGPEHRRERAMAKGAEYMAAENYAKASIEFRNALQVAPKDPEARYQNGRVAEKLGRYQEAANFYQATIDVQPDHVAARADLGRLYLFSGLPERAMETIRAGLEKHPEDSGLLTVLAAARAQQKDPVGALVAASRAVKNDPKNENAVATLGGLFAAAGRTDEARTTLEQGIKDVPKSIELRLALAQLAMQTKDAARAESLLEELTQLKPHDAANPIRLAHFLVSVGKDDAAEATLRDALKRDPDSHPLKFGLVDFLAGRRGKEAAEKELQTLISAAPDDVELRFALAKFYEAGGEPAKAEAIYSEVISRDGVKPPGLSARVRLASARLSQNDPASAERLVGEVLAESPRDSDALILRGNMLLSKRDPRGAIADLRAVLRDQPNAVGVLRVLARAHLMNNEPVLAEETLRRAVDAAPADRSARLDLASFLLQNGRVEPAKAMLQRLATEEPTDTVVQDALFKAAVASEDLVAAKAAAEAIISVRPGAGVGYLYRGVAAEAERRLPEALKDYQKAAELAPDAPDVLQATVLLLVKLKRAPEALKVIDAAMPKLSASAIPQRLKGQILLAEKRLPDAEAAFTAAIAAAPKWWLLYQDLATVASEGHDPARAAKILEGALDKVDDPASLRLALAQALASTGHVDEAVKQYDAVLEKTPQAQAAANNLAMLLVSHRTDAASLARAAELTKPFADSPNANLLDTYGWVRLKTGDAAGAVAVLEKAQARAPSVPVFAYHLGVAQIAAGQPAQGRESLQKALAHGATFPGADDARATLAKASGGR